MFKTELCSLAPVTTEEPLPSPSSRCTSNFIPTSPAQEPEHEKEVGTCVWHTGAGCRCVGGETCSTARRACQLSFARAGLKTVDDF